MWEEADQAEFEALNDALAHATEPVRSINYAAIYSNQTGQLWLHGNTSPRDHTILYFWLCGYGDRMAVEKRKQPVCAPPPAA